MPSSLGDGDYMDAILVRIRCDTRKHTLLIASQLRRVTTVRHYMYPSWECRAPALIENYKRTLSVLIEVVVRRKT